AGGGGEGGGAGPGEGAAPGAGGRAGGGGRAAPRGRESPRGGGARGPGGGGREGGGGTPAVAARDEALHVAGVDRRRHVSRPASSETRQPCLHLLPGAWRRRQARPDLGVVVDVHRGQARVGREPHLRRGLVGAPAGL